MRLALSIVVILAGFGFLACQCAKAVHCARRGGTPVKGWFGQAECIEP